MIISHSKNVEKIRSICVHVSWSVFARVVLEIFLIQYLLLFCLRGFVFWEGGFDGGGEIVI